MKPSESDAVQTILKAARFASLRHTGQRRKGAAAEPYVNHVIEVAELIASALPEPDPNLICAALLHDTVEDTATKLEEIAAAFGYDVAGLVHEVTDDKTLPKAERKRLQVANAPHKSARAQTLKVADKISNLRAILFSPPADWNLTRRQEYFAWAKQVVDGCTAANPILKAEFEALVQRAPELGSK